jgi:autoinducer 2-degrading protein
MFIVIVTLDVDPDRVDEFSELIAANARSSVELEPGCLVFEVNRSLEIANRFYLYEVYTSEEAFVVEHKGSDHFATFIARSAPLTIPGSKTEVYASRTAAEKKKHDHTL